MENVMEFQKEHIDAIRDFYEEVNRRTNYQYSLTDVVIAWLTEGHAEKFRQEQIHKRALVIS